YRRTTITPTLARPPLVWRSTMKPGDQIGPFTIEKLIGAGAMGAVYRGVYNKTGRKVAIKVMLPGMAQNQQSVDRFTREIAILMVLADDTLKLTDFGIAKDLDVTQLTEANCTVGTASYMSPEQCRGERNLTYKSDLYSLGVVLYELLTGKKPFVADSVMDMFMMHVKGTFARPAHLIVDIPKWLDTLVCQMLEKKPEQRPRDAATIGNALIEVLEKV